MFVACCLCLLCFLCVLFISCSVVWFMFLFVCFPFLFFPLLCFLVCNLCFCVPIVSFRRICLCLCWFLGFVNLASPICLLFAFGFQQKTVFSVKFIVFVFCFQIVSFLLYVAVCLFLLWFRFCFIKLFALRSFAFPILYVICFVFMFWSFKFCVPY